MPDDPQGFLFGPPPPRPSPAPRITPHPAPPDINALARRLPPTLHLGTSSWTFPGWAGLVYHAPASPASKPLSERALAEPGGLAAYAAFPLFRTVGLDRAFYRPLPTTEYRTLRDSVPPAFRFLVKAWQSLTRPDADDSGRTHGPTAAHSAANPLFLDPAAATDLVLAPASLGLGPALGPVVFQFPPLDLSSSGRLGGVLPAVKRIAAFVRALPQPRAHAASAADPAPPVLCAIEVRNRAFFDAAHIAELARACRDSGWCTALAGHPALPPIAEQARAIEHSGWARSEWPAFVARWLLRADQTYDGARKRYAPFDRIVDPDQPALDGLAALCARAAGLGRSGWVIINNKAEGSAPLSVVRLAQAVANVPTRTEALPDGPSSGCER